MDSLRSDIEELQGTKEFQEYKKSSTNSYLCAAFTIVESSAKANWQIDFYCPDNDKITTFCLRPNMAQKEAKTLHRDENKIHELNLENVDVDFDESLKITSDLKSKNYPNENVNKIITILQNINNREIWNITYLTSSFNVLNVNIDAQNGNIIKEKFESVMNFGSKLPDKADDEQNDGQQGGKKV